MHAHCKCLRAHIKVLPCTTYAYTCKHKTHTRACAYTCTRVFKACDTERLESPK